MKYNKVFSSVICLYFDRLFDKQYLESKDLRGAIAGLYPNEILLHQHYKDGTVKYNYPLVQYKFIQEKCLIVGIDDGAKVISNLNLIGELIILSHCEYRIIKNDASFQELPFGIAKPLSYYSFLTPWLALMEEFYNLMFHFGISSRAARGSLYDFKAGKGEQKGLYGKSN